MQLNIGFPAGSSLRLLPTQLAPCAWPQCPYQVHSHNLHQGHCCGRCRLQPGSGHEEQCQRHLKAPAPPPGSYFGTVLLHAEPSTEVDIWRALNAELRSEIHQEAIRRHEAAQTEQTLRDELNEALVRAIVIEEEPRANKRTRFTANEESGLTEKHAESNSETLL